MFSKTIKLALGLMLSHAFQTYLNINISDQVLDQTLGCPAHR